MPLNESTPSVLRDIVESRRADIPSIRERIAHVDPDRLAPSTRSLFDALGGGRPPGERNRFIMEVKSASPSRGQIRSDFDPLAIASTYSRFASGISVLCEPTRFGGDYNHLATVRASTHLPTLCKDFVIDEAQVIAARYFGADAILLMLSVLEDSEYARLAGLADRLGLDVITEVIDAEEVRRATRLGARIFGVNHRDLHDLTIDLNRTRRLAPLIPSGAVVLAESGITDHACVASLGGLAHGFLVGSQLMAADNLDRAARELVFGTNKVCGLRSISQAQAARACGAVWGGLIVEPDSPRDVSAEDIEAIVSGEPALRYALVTRRTRNWHDLPGLGLSGVEAVQVHAPFQGSVSAERDLIARAREELRDVIERRPLQIWRALSMDAAGAPEAARELANEVDLLVLDAGDGGSGRTFDWSRIPESVKSRSLLAGGIGPGNVRAALAVGCMGLDLNSGVEYPVASGNWSRWKDSGALRRIFGAMRHFHHSGSSLGSGKYPAADGQAETTITTTIHPH